MRTHLHHLVDRWTGPDADRPALTDRHRTLTYAELTREARAVAIGLRGLGLVRGDRVGIWLDKRAETVVSMLAASAAGLVFVPVNPALKPAQVHHVLADCDVRVLVTSEQRWDQLAASDPRLPALDQVVLVGRSGAAAPRSAVLATDSCPWTHRWDDLHRAGTVVLSRGTHDLRETGTDGDVAAILYTSGSTGRPKGVVLTHRNLLVGAESVSSYLGNRPDDVLLALLPLSFDAGLSQVTTACAVGAHVVLTDYLLPGDVVRLCAEHGVTGLTCVPPLWHQLASVPWPPEATRLRYFANTGGRMPAPLLARLRALFPEADPYLMYGLTEAFRSTYLDPAEVDARPGSIGRAVPDAEILVVRPDGSLAGPGEEGELVHRGASVALGYWNDPERTAERFRPVPGPQAGWRAPEIAVWSGDTVVTDADGYLYFVGRTDEMIKTSGYRVSPTEVEEAAHATGLVGEAVALGVDDERLGQRIVLVVSPSDASPGSDASSSGSAASPVSSPGPGATGTATAPAPVDTGQLLAALRRSLPRFMVPGEVHQRDVLPRSPNGKLDRTLLRAEVTS